jgi:hypothetical protein
MLVTAKFPNNFVIAHGAHIEESDPPPGTVVNERHGRDLDANSIGWPKSRSR